MAFDLLIAFSLIFPRTHGFRSTTIPAVINNNNNVVSLNRASVQAELAALASVLRTVHVQSPLLYLCDYEAVLQDVARWIGEGHQTSMATKMQTF